MDRTALQKTIDALVAIRARNFVDNFIDVPREDKCGDDHDEAYELFSETEFDGGGKSYNNNKSSAAVQDERILFPPLHTQLKSLDTANRILTIDTEANRSVMSAFHQAQVHVRQNISDTARQSKIGEYFMRPTLVTMFTY